MPETSAALTRLCVFSGSRLSDTRQHVNRTSESVWANQSEGALQPEKTGKIQIGSRFAPGRSGNPDGRPKGARNRTTLAIEALLDGEAEAITRKAIELAKDGDMAAIRICLDRLCPPRRDRHVSFSIPEIASAADAAKASSAILTAVSDGELTPSEAAELGKLVESYVKALEATEFEERLRRLEATGVRK